MPLKLHLKTQLDVPLDVGQVIPENLAGEDFRSIPVKLGNRTGRLSDFFDVEGSAAKDRTVCFSGNLKNLFGIGSAMSCGTIEVHGDAGPFVGRSMSGGKIIVIGNTDDYLGAEMTGGQIVVQGNSSNYVGANTPGGKYGMNRGTIFISGCAGQSLGRRMRRGMIVVQGDVGALCGWEMMAGTILVFGAAPQDTGIDMRRGTIILAGESSKSFHPRSSFVKGTTSHSQTIAMIGAWLERSEVEIPRETIQQRLIAQQFLQWHGDLTEGGRGEIFLAVEASS